MGNVSAHRLPPLKPPRAGTVLRNMRPRDEQGCDRGEHLCARQERPEHLRDCGHWSNRLQRSSRRSRRAKKCSYGSGRGFPAPGMSMKRSAAAYARAHPVESPTCPSNVDPAGTWVWRLGLRPAVAARRRAGVAAQQRAAGVADVRRRAAMAAEAWAAQLAVWADGPLWSATAASAAFS